MFNGLFYEIFSCHITTIIIILFMRLSIVISLPHVAVHTCIHKKGEQKKKKKKKLSYVVSLFVICKLYMHSSGFLNCNLTPAHSNVRRKCHLNQNSLAILCDIVLTKQSFIGNGHQQCLICLSVFYFYVLKLQFDIHVVVQSHYFV